ncbi:MAG: GNAT family N-acetyltransferase [Halobacteriales archaeon]|nr:GNAT family N-acetyltransferase [Halobacteriales archaeon]
MDCVWLGGPEDGPTLRLDHERFAYAGKFVMSNTGKAVARTDDDVLGAIAFNRDRTDDAWWIRYVTVRVDRRGNGIGTDLIEFVASRLIREGASAVRIAVNNPFAYEACYKAGFGYAGRETGLAEVVLQRPAPTRPDAYGEGLQALQAARDLTPDERRFLEDRIHGPPPPHPNR